MTLSTLDLFVLAGYFALVIWIGLWFARQKTSQIRLGR